jgi:hypothetical protein
LKCLGRSSMLTTFGGRATESGRLETKKETFETMCKAPPLMNELYELKTAITQVRAASDVPRMRNGKPIHFLPVGPDCINRTALMPFGTLSGRNARSTTAFSFNLATGLRSLIDPRWMTGYERGEYGFAYLDPGQQEFAMQAQRSMDMMMMTAACSTSRAPRKRMGISNLQKYGQEAGLRQTVSKKSVRIHPKSFVCQLRSDASI